MDEKKITDTEAGRATESDTPNNGGENSKALRETIARILKEIKLPERRDLKAGGDAPQKSLPQKWRLRLPRRPL